VKIASKSHSEGIRRALQALRQSAAKPLQSDHINSERGKTARGIPEDPKSGFVEERCQTSPYILLHSILIHFCTIPYWFLNPLPRGDR
jgi:hypothetical protein